MSNVRGSGRGKQLGQDANLMNLSSAQFQLPVVPPPHADYRNDYQVPPPQNVTNYQYRYGNQQFAQYPAYGYARPEFSQQSAVYPQYTPFQSYSQEQPAYQTPHQPAPVSNPAPSRSKKILSFINPDSQAPVELPTRQDKSPASALTSVNPVDAERKTQTNREFMDKVKKELNNKESSPNKPELAAEIAQAVVEDTKEEVIESPPPAVVPSQSEQEVVPVEEKTSASKNESTVAAVSIQSPQKTQEEVPKLPDTNVVEERSERPALVKEESKEDAEPDDKFDEKIPTRETSPSQADLTEQAVEKTPEEIAKEESARIAEEAEKRRLKEIELDSMVETHLAGGEVDPRIGLYSRAFMVTIRDIERDFKRTPCPLTPTELAEFGLDIKTMRIAEKKANFNPPWALNNKQRPNNPYRGRTTTDGTGRGASRHERGVNKKPPVVRQSIERIQRITLPTSKDAWKPTRQKGGDEISEEEAKVKDVCKKVRSLMNKITPTSKVELIKDFIDFKVSSNDDQLVQVVNIIFDKAVEEPKFCALYAEVCHKQVDHEVKHYNQKSPFRNKILTRAQSTFEDKTLEIDEEKLKMMETETDPLKKEKMRLEILEEQQKFRRRKFGNMTFIGHLFRNSILSTKIVIACIYELLRSIKDNTNLTKESIDEESVHCALQLFETIGAIVDKDHMVFLDQWFLKLEQAKPFCTNKIKFMIMNLVELRKNKWVPRKSVETGPKKLEDIQKEVRQEQIEKANREQFDRRHGGGVRTNSNSLKKQGPVARNSIERKGFQQPEQKRAAAAATTKLTSSNVQPKNITLSQMSDTSFGKSKKEWHSGASGGGMSTSSDSAKTWGRRDSNDSRKKSMADEKQAALSAVREMGSNELSRRSSSQTSIADKPEEEELTEEQINARSKLMNIIHSDIQEILSGEVPIKEVVDTFFDVTRKEKYAFPPVVAVYEMAIRAASARLKKVNEVVTLGHILRLTLTDKAKKQAFIDGVIKFAKYAVDTEMWLDSPEVWSTTGEVLMNASHLPSELLTEENQVQVLSMADLTPVFLAAKTSEEKNKYALLVAVVRRLAELEITEQKKDIAEGVSWEFQDLSTREEMMKDGLLEEMANCKLKNGKTLKDVLGI